MKKRILSMLLLAVIMITMLSACSENGTGTAAKSRISIATGGSGGVFYTLGAGMADICNQNSDSIESVSETTAATAENLKLVQLGEAEIGFSVYDAVADAYNGTQPYEKHDKLRLIMQGHSGYIHIYANANTDMESPSDFKGKKISMAPGDIGVALLGNTLAAYGLTMDDISGMPMSMTETTTALQDSTIHAGFQMMGIPGSSLMEISNMMAIKMISIDDAALDKIIEAKPAWAKGVIPAGTYNGQDEEITTLKVPYCIYTSSDVSDEVVYEFTKQILENTETLKQMHVEGQHYSEDNELFELDPQLPYHPGAEKYLKEIGVLK